MQEDETLIKDEDLNLDESDIEEKETGEKEPGAEDDSKDEPNSTGEGKPKEEPDAKGKKQTRGENRHFKELRELRKRNGELQNENARLVKEKEEAVFSAKANVVSDDVLEAIGIDKIEDQEDLDLANAYIEAERQGKSDPVKEAYKTIRERAKQERAKEDTARTEREAQLKAVAEDKKAFIAKYGEEAFNEAIKEGSEFMKLYGPDQNGNGSLEHGNLTKLYERYLSIKTDDKISEQAKAMGVLPNSSGGGAKRSDDAAMNDNEFEDYFKKKYYGG